MTWTLYQGDCIDRMKQLPDESVNCCVTSPPYWKLRDYGIEGQHGMESTFEEYITKMIEVFHEVKRILAKDGTLWLNLADCYSQSFKKGGGGCFENLRPGWKQCQHSKEVPRGLKPKELIGLPWHVAFALQADGWYLRSDIIWNKPNPMPESIKDRPTKSHEYIFLLAKSNRYYYDHEAIKEPATYIQPNSPESIKSPYGQGYTRRANNGVGFGHGTDKEKRARDRVRVSKGVINGPLNSGHRKSGNKERKMNVSGRLNTHMGSSVPWEGLTRNKRTVWTIPTKPFSGAHFATFPPELIVPCILAGCPESV